MRKQLDFLDEHANHKRIIWYLAWPTVLEQLMITMVQYVDTAMVGSLGEQATASVAVSASTTWLIGGIFAAFGVGFSVLVGKSIGARDYEYAKRVICQAVIAIVVAGLLITGIVQIIAPFLPMWMGAEPAIWSDGTAYLSIISLAYMFNLAVNVCSAILRCSGDTRTPLIFNTLTNVINIILNTLFIFPTRAVSIFGMDMTLPGLGLGVSGAAIASAISVAFSGSMLALALFIKKHPIRISIKDKFRFDKKIWADMIKLATPVALERITISTGHIAMTAIVTQLGTVALSAHHLAITAEGITYMPAFGFSAAATTLVSQSMGANKPKLGFKYGKVCTWGGILFMTVMGVALFVFAEQLMSIFSPVEEVVSLGAQVLRLEAFAQPFFAASMVAAGALRGAGDTKWPFYISVIGMWGVRLGIAYICAYPLGLGLFGAWIGMVADIAVRGILTYWRYASGRWLNKNRFIEEANKT